MSLVSPAVAGKFFTTESYVSWVVFENIFCVCKLVSVSIEMCYHPLFIFFGYTGFLLQCIGGCVVLLNIAA